MRRAASSRPVELGAIDYSVAGRCPTCRRRAVDFAVAAVPSRRSVLERWACAQAHYWLTWLGPDDRRRPAAELDPLEASNSAVPA